MEAPKTDKGFDQWMAKKKAAGEWKGDPDKLDPKYSSKAFTKAPVAKNVPAR